MSQKKRSNEIVAVLVNTDVKNKIWDSPNSGQGGRRDGPLSDSVRFVPDGKVGMTAEQMEKMGKPPRGVVVETFDKRKHRDVKRMG